MASGGSSFPTQLQQVTVPVRSDAQCTYGISGGQDGYYVHLLPQLDALRRPGRQGHLPGRQRRPPGGRPGRRVPPDRHHQLGHRLRQAATPACTPGWRPSATGSRPRSATGPSPTPAPSCAGCTSTSSTASPPAPSCSTASTGLDHGTPTRALPTDLVQGATFQGRTAGVTRLYRAFFLRDPDTAGHGLLVGPGQRQAVAGPHRRHHGRLGRVPEPLRQPDRTASTSTWCTRTCSAGPADSAGRAFWVGELSSGRRNRGDVMVGFSESLRVPGRHQGPGRRHHHLLRPPAPGARSPTS